MVIKGIKKNIFNFADNLTYKAPSLLGLILQLIKFAKNMVNLSILIFEIIIDFFTTLFEIINEIFELFFNISSRATSFRSVFGL